GMSISSTIRSDPPVPRQMRQEYACWVSGLVGAVLLTGTVCQVRGGATITEIHGFDNHFNPSSLLQTEDGSFYGTIAGATNCGMIFRIAPNGSLSSFYPLREENELKEPLGAIGNIITQFVAPASVP